jgi:hypothetical protein
MKSLLLFLALAYQICAVMDIIGMDLSNDVAVSDVSFTNYTNDIANKILVKILMLNH